MIRSRQFYLARPNWSLPRRLSARLRAIRAHEHPRRAVDDEAYRGGLGLDDWTLSRHINNLLIGADVQPDVDLCNLIDHQRDVALLGRVEAVLVDLDVVASWSKLRHGVGADIGGRHNTCRIGTNLKDRNGRSVYRCPAEIGDSPCDRPGNTLAKRSPGARDHEHERHADDKNRMQE